MAPTTLTYRKATPDDAAAVAALVRSAYRGESSRAGWTTEADLVAGDRIDQAGVLAKINEPLGAVLLAYDEAAVLVGCCELRKQDDALGYFGLFAVDPTRQARGIGHMIVTEAEAYAKRVWGLGRLEMTVIWVREELIAWYVRRGYVRLEETRPFPYDELVNGHALRDDLYFTVLVKTI